MSKLPRQLSIGPYIWQVRRGKKAWKSHGLETADAVCHNKTQLIVVRPGLSLAYERVCVIHEILHAARDSAHHKIDLNDAEESFINAVAPILTAVLQDNPKLLDYLGLT